MDDRPAGFGIRFVATVVDLFVVTIPLLAFSRIVNSCGIYVPIETAVILAYIVYSTVCISLFGGTPGKLALGLVVRGPNEKRPGFFRAFWREAFGKLISGLLAMSGFLKIAVSKNKRGYHDCLANTSVRIRTADATGRKRIRIITSSVVALIVCWISVKAVVICKAFSNADIRTAGAAQASRGAHAGPETITDEERLRFSTWLEENSRDPNEYLVEIARTHQVTLLGETHGKKEYLDFLANALPALYHEASVTCIGMECCMARDNDALYRLVTGEVFDRQLAMEIARRSAWEAWGYSEYWRILEVAWEINHTLPIGQKPLRVVGINFSWDGPSMALTAAGPWWEKLRIVRCWDDYLLSLFCGDGFYAAHVERDIMEKYERGVVLVGAAHTLLNDCDPFYGLEIPRMGQILREKYGENIAQIVLHSLHVSEEISHFIELVADMQGKPLAFSVIESPIGEMRDESRYFRHRAAAVFADSAESYIYIKQQEKLTPCRWSEGYVTRRMFGKNRPYYELLCDRRLNSYEEANHFLGVTMGILRPN